MIYKNIAGMVPVSENISKFDFTMNQELIKELWRDPNYLIHIIFAKEFILDSKEIDIPILIEGCAIRTTTAKLKTPQWTPEYIKAPVTNIHFKNAHILSKYLDLEQIVKSVSRTMCGTEVTLAQVSDSSFSFAGTLTPFPYWFNCFQETLKAIEAIEKALRWSYGCLETRLDFQGGVDYGFNSDHTDILSFLSPK